MDEPSRYEREILRITTPEQKQKRNLDHLEELRKYDYQPMIDRAKLMIKIIESDDFKKYESLFYDNEKPSRQDFEDEKLILNHYKVQVEFMEKLTFEGFYQKYMTAEIRSIEALKEWIRDEVIKLVHERGIPQTPTDDRPICETCGRQFRGTHRSQRYCSARCSQEAQRKK